jgi:N12 class adenine-specific DNA methylase
MLAGAEGAAPVAEPVSAAPTPLPAASVPPAQPVAAQGPLSRARDAMVRSVRPQEEAGGFPVVDYPGSEGGTAEALGTGLLHGTTRLGETIGTLTDIAGRKLGIPSLSGAGRVAKEFWEGAAENFKPDTKLQGDILKKPELLGESAWWAYNIADTVPSFAASIIPALGAGRGIQVLGKAIQWTPQVIARLAQIGGSVAGGSAGGALEGASTFEEVLKRGGTEDQALLAGETMTLASAGLNAISVGKMLKSPGAKSRLLNWLTTGAVEAGTEYLEEPAEILAKNVVAEPENVRKIKAQEAFYDENARVSYEPPSAEEAKKQLISGINVIPPSFIMGLMGGAGSALRETREEKKGGKAAEEAPPPGPTPSPEPAPPAPKAAKKAKKETVNVPEAGEKKPAPVAEEGKGVAFEPGKVDQLNPALPPEIQQEILDDPEMGYGGKSPREQGITYVLKNSLLHQKYLTRQAEKPKSELRPVPHEVSDAPVTPPGDRWTGDRGAIPGEPSHFLDVQDDDFGTAKAGIVEVQNDKGEAVWEAKAPGGKSLGQFTDLEAAAKAAEAHVGDRRTAPRPVRSPYPESQVPDLPTVDSDIQVVDSHIANLEKELKDTPASDTLGRMELSDRLSKHKGSLDALKDRRKAILAGEKPKPIEVVVPEPARKKTEAEISFENARAERGAVPRSGEKLDPTSKDVRLDREKRNLAIKQSKATGTVHLDQLPHGVEAIRGKRIESIFDGSKGTVTSANSDGTTNIVWDDEASAKHNLGSLETDKVGKKEVQQWASHIGQSDKADFKVLPETRVVKQGVVEVPEAKKAPVEPPPSVPPEAPVDKGGEGTPKPEVTRAKTDQKLFKGLPIDKPGKDLTDADMDVITAPEGRPMSERNRDLGKHESDPRFLVYLKPGQIGYQPNLSPHLQPVMTDYRLVRDFLKDGTLPERGKELQKIADRYRAIDDKISETAAIKSAAMVRTAIERGAYNSMLHPSNKISRNIFYEITGQKLPAGVGATQKFFTLKPFEKKAAWLKEKAKEETPESAPVVTWKKAAIIPTRDGVKAIPIEEKVSSNKALTLAQGFSVGDTVYYRTGWNKAGHKISHIDSEGNIRLEGSKATVSPTEFTKNKEGAAGSLSPEHALRADLARKGAGTLGNIDYKILQNDKGRYSYEITKEGVRRTVEPLLADGLGWATREEVIENAITAAEVRKQIAQEPVTSPLTTEKKPLPIESGGVPDVGGTGEGVREGQLLDGPPSVAPGEQAAVREEDVLQGPVGTPDVPVGEGGAGAGPGVQPSGKGTSKVPDRRDRGGAGDIAAPAGEGTGAVAGVPEVRNHPVGREPVRIEDRNHVIAPGDIIVPAGKVGRINANIKALELSRKLEAENRNPSPEEKKILAQFSGWGSLAQDVFGFDKEVVYDRQKDGTIQSWQGEPEKYKKWFDRIGKKLHPDLGGILSKEEWNAAKASTMNAHYTSREVISKGLWPIAERLGIKGGRIVEPSAGIGHILGLMPEGIAKRAIVQAVELDKTSGAMLKRLYPEANVQITGFQTAQAMKDNSADLAISNVPFGKYPVTDPKHKDYSGWSIHNYFIARKIDLVRPGGIVIAITSHYTLDSASGGKMRDYFAKKADFVGAVRLPSAAFEKSAGTEVVTDILVFRKKDASQFTGAQQFRNVLTVETAAGENAPVNEYFINHPEMVLGEHSMKGSMYGGDGKEYTLLPGKEPLEEALAKAVNSFPAAIAGEGALVSQQGTVFAESGTKNGILLEKDGQLYVNEGGELVRPDFTKYAARVVVAKRYIGVRDLAKELIHLQLDEGSTDAQIEAQRTKLNKAYDEFVKRHGPVSDKSHQWLSEDGEYPLALSLEKQVEVPKTYLVKSGPNKGQTTTAKEKTFVKAAIFTERTIFPFKEPVSAESADDAVKISMTYRNKVDAAYIAKLLNSTVEGVTEKLANDGLAYINPATGLLEGQDEYLSGNVRDKLIRAEEAVKDDPRFEKNIEALKRVQPKDLEIDQIYMRIGSTWVPTEAYTDFIKDTLGMDIAVSYSESADNSKFFMDNPRHGLSALAQNTWGVDGANALDILKDSFNLKFTEVRIDVGERNAPKWVVDEKRTIAAREMQKKLQAEFLSWTRKSEKWAPVLKDIYNRDKNNMVLKTAHTPTMKHYPGASHSITLHPHQKRAVSRSLQESTLLAHAVGTGKTYIFATTAMEMRRIGTAKKPMIVVQGSTLNQYGRAFRELYPTARVLIPNTRQLQAKNRKKLLAQIATGDWDAVVLQHSTYDMLSVKPEKEAAYVQEQVAELEAIIKEMEARGEDKRTVKQWEKLKKNKEEKIVALLARGHKEGMLNFDDLGVDALLVDEAHKYKRSEFYTKMDRVKGIDSGSAGRSMLHLLKTAEVRGKTGGKNVIIATGTPISNTMAELWTHLRYIRPDLMEAYGVTSFDAFAANFGNVKTELEETMTTDFKEVSRFAEYVNGPELLTMWRTAADVIMAEDVNVARPTIKGGAPRQIMLERPAELASFIQGIKLQKEAWDKLPGREKRDSRHVPMVLFGLAKKAAIDLRLVDSSRPDIPGSKVNRLVEEAVQVWKDTKELKAAQVIFSDLYQSPDGKFNLFEDIKKKLIKNGVPESEIAIIHDYKTDEKRESLFAKVNDGEVRFVMGGTEKLGVGVNIQERLVRAHHLDIPGRPMDFEQRNGRIWRPGNTIDTIDITTYGHKATMDSVAAQRLQTKQKFINQILRGDLQDRTFEDPFDPAQGTFEDMMASFGNPKVREKFGLESQIRNLKSLKSSHENEIGRARTTIWQNNNGIERLEASAKEWESAIKILAKAFPDGKVVEFKLSGVKGDFDRDSFVEHFTEVEKTLRAKTAEAFKNVNSRDRFYELKSNGVNLSQVYSGTVNGIPFGMRVESTVDYNYVNMAKGDGIIVTVGDAGFRYQLFEKTMSDKLGANRTVSTPRGVMSSIETFVRNAQEKPAELRKETDRLAKQNKDLGELLDKPFDHEDDLAAKESRLIEVEAELKAMPVEDLSKTPADEIDLTGLTGLPDPVMAKEVAPEADWWEGKVLGKEDVADAPTTKKYFVAKGVQSDTPGFQEVKGYAVDIEEGTDTFVHHVMGRKSWTVSEGRSGLGFGGIHDTREAAIEGAKNAIDTLPGKSLKKWLDENLTAAVEKQDQGYSPRYGKKPTASSSDPEQALADVVNKVIPESEPSAGLSIRPVDVVIGKPEYSEKDYAFGTEESEARYKAAHGLKPEPLLGRAREVVRALVNKATREYEHLPRNAEFAPLRTALLRLSKQKGVAADRTVRAMQAITVKFDKVRMGLFERKVLLDDLAEEAKADHLLPFGFTKESVAAELAKIDRLVGRDPVVEQGLFLRQEFSESVKQSYISAMGAIGFKVADRFTKENYFRHQVIEYANLKGVAGTGKRLRTPTGRGFLKKRKGSEYDINTNYLEAEYEVIAQMLYDIEVAKTIKAVDDVYNVASMTKDVGIPEGYIEWQPREGNTFYMAESIPAKLADQLREGALDMAEVDPDLIRQVMALGGKRKRFIVKQEVADTLNSLLKAKPQGVLLGYDKKILTGWKVWQLVSPRRFFKYNFRNLTGDADAAFVGNPSTFKKVPQAARELYQVFTSDRGMTPEMREWFKRGGFETTLQAQELSELNKMRIFSHVREAGEPLRDLPVAAFKKYWKTVRLATDFRESVLRYAAFLDYIEQIKADPKGTPKNFGASIPEEITAIKDPHDKAFTLSNQLLGAYDQVSVMGNAMRDHLIPFWSWKEVNFRRYIQFAKNAASDKKVAEAVGRKALGAFAKTPYTAWRVGKFLISATAFWAMLQAWNNLMFPEEEDELDEQNRNRPHIIFGRDPDGKIINFTRIGALGDFLQWFGLDAFPLHVSRWASGKRTLREIALEMAKSPVNVIAQGITPIAKTPAELASGKVLFPDVFKPRTIRDRGYYLAQSVGLENEYKEIAGLPSEGYQKSLAQFFVYRADPGQNAYSDILQARSRYLEKIGKASEGAFISPKNNALYNLRLAIRYKDADAKEKFMEEYLSLNGTPEGIRSSLDRMHPLGGMNKKDGRDFVNTLDAEEKDKLAKAIHFHENVLSAGERDIVREARIMRNRILRERR